MKNVYSLKVNVNLDYNRFKKLESYLSISKRKRIRSFLRFEDAQQTLLADLLIRHMVCKKTKKVFGQIEFAKNKYGKPYLKDKPDLHFNVSHSGEWIVAAIHNYPVGIDIEQIKPINYKIVKYFFSKSEYEYLMGTDDSNISERFYELWTLKESYIKAIGLGFHMPLNSFSICINDGDIIVETESKPVCCYFRQYDVGNKYKMAICSLANELNKEMETYDIEKFYNEICSQYNI